MKHKLKTLLFALVLGFAVVASAVAPTAATAQACCICPGGTC